MIGLKKCWFCYIGEVNTDVGLCQDCKDYLDNFAHKMMEHHKSLTPR